jgi:site-specific DNA-methyltransferase (adenine-specific)
LAIKNSIKFVQGDFFEKIKKVETESVDFIFADPPYFLSNGGISVASGKQVIVDKGDWDKVSSKSSAFQFQDEWIEQVRRVLAPNGSIVISGTYHSIFQCANALERHGYKILNDIIWFKPNGAPNLSGRRLTASHETLLWAAKSEKSKFVYNYKDMKALDFDGDQIKKPGKQLRSVWWIPNTPQSEKIHGRHPTQKPLRLLRRVVSAFSLPGQLVFDPFMGSGTTAVACKELQRNFLGIELSKEYVELAQKRIRG